MKKIKIIQKILSSINQVSFDLNEIIEEKENKEIKDKDKDFRIKKSNEIEKKEKNNKKEIKENLLVWKRKKMKWIKTKKANKII